MGDWPFGIWNVFAWRVNRWGSICVLPSLVQERRIICQPRSLAIRLQYKRHLTLYHCTKFTNVAVSQVANGESFAALTEETGHSFLILKFFS